MKYRNFKNQFNAAIGRYSISSESASMEYTRWLLYYASVYDIMLSGLWRWAIGEVTSASSSFLLTLPWDSIGYPVLVANEDIDGEPIFGRTVGYKVYQYNKMGDTINPDGFWVPDGKTTSAEYTFTYASHTGNVYTIAESLTSAQATAIVGKTLRFDNEQSYYYVSSAVAGGAGSATITIDRAYQKPGASDTSPDANATIEIEPPGAAKIRFTSEGTYYIQYMKRFRPAVADDDDCGWDSTLDAYMPLLIASKYLIQNGDQSERQRGHEQYGYASNQIQSLLRNDVDGPGVISRMDADPDSPLGKRRSFTIGSISRQRKHRVGNDWWG